MNEQNRPTRQGSEKSSVSPLVTLLACLLTGLVVFLATFFSLTGYYGSEILSLIHI